MIQPSELVFRSKFSSELFSHSFIHLIIEITPPGEDACPDHPHPGPAGLQSLLAPLQVESRVTRKFRPFYTNSYALSHLLVDMLQANNQFSVLNSLGYKMSY